MRADRPLLTVLTFVVTLVLGYAAYAVSASVHPGPATAPSAQAEEREK